jgi:hypothetical protein
MFTDEEFEKISARVQEQVLADAVELALDIYKQFAHIISPPVDLTDFWQRRRDGER